MLIHKQVVKINNKYPLNKFPENQKIMNKKIYLICTTPRSGSNLLSALLESSGMMGQPSEYLNHTGTIPTLAKKHNLIDTNSTIILRKYLDFVIHNRSSANNVCGIKLFFNQLERFLDFPEMREILQQCHFIFLTRKDLVAQAVSMYIATETNIWKSMKEDKSSRDFVEYNELKINSILENLIKQNNKWSEFFGVNKLNYLEVNYEEILENSNQLCQKICSFCGVDVSNYKFLLESSRFKKQGDSLNQKFANIFYENYKLNLAKQMNSPELKLNGIKIV